MRIIARNQMPKPKPRPRPRRPPVQLSLAARGGPRGGYRAGAGRKPKAPEDRKGHRVRPALAARHPVHVTLKVVPGIESLRRGRCFQELRQAFVRGKDRFGFRLAHFTVQGNHLHLICEAADARALTRGMQGLSIRIARGLNRRLARRGRLFAERYHARVLKTPTEVRRCLIYVYQNTRKHRDGAIDDRDWIDPCTSAAWFDGWTRPRRDLHLHPDGEPPVARSRTWLLSEGWRKLGRLRAGVSPRSSAPPG